ncbi:MAG: PH domain-containing protein [Patescibacteria group bacterium]
MPDIFTSTKPKLVGSKKVLYKDLPSNVHNPLSSIVFCPENLKFETMDGEEKIVLFLRKHWITNLGWILMCIVLFLTPTLVSSTEVLAEVPDNFRFIFMLIWYLISTAYFLESFLTWFFNVYIVTDERIIDIDFYNLIYKEISDANIDKIQDVTLKMGGAIRVLFNYGDVMIQTASEVPNFEFLSVPYPDKVVKVLQDLRMEEQQEAIEGRIR